MLHIYTYMYGVHTIYINRKALLKNFRPHPSGRRLDQESDMEAVIGLVL